jgi:hypothetical protein
MAPMQRDVPCPGTPLLITYAGAVGDTAGGTRTGGVPLVPAGFVWPRCRTCRGPMQFLTQVALRDVDPADRGQLAVFMCQNRPGGCEEWSATSGGNRAYVFDRVPLAPAWVPVGEATLLCAAWGFALVPLEHGDYPTALAAQGRAVLGQLGGSPAWLQGDETPACARCSRPMTFVLQLQEGHEPSSAANFGMGGRAYAFRCPTCPAAAFLWQR